VDVNWDRLVQNHGPAVFGIAWRILGHAVDAEEVVQDVFLEAFRVRGALPVKNWPGLLRRLATCRALDRRRSRKPALSLDALGLVETNTDPEAAAVGRELAERLREAVAQLPEQEGAVFSLRYYEDLSNQEIAETLNVSPGAVAAALHRARAKLAAQLLGVAKGE
jgi:RNA polymerase sigma-70 factor (ECF subfamily)